MSKKVHCKLGDFLGGLQEIGHQSRSATASLLIKNYQCMKEVYKLKFDLQPGSLTVQLAGEHQPSKKHP